LHKVEQVTATEQHAENMTQPSDTNMNWGEGQVRGVPDRFLVLVHLHIKFIQRRRRGEKLEE
jgi:hypothetical protein